MQHCLSIGETYKIKLLLLNVYIQYMVDWKVCKAKGRTQWEFQHPIINIKTRLTGNEYMDKFSLMSFQEFCAWVNGNMMLQTGKELPI